VALTLPWRPDSLHKVRTRDGAQIALGRYHGRGANKRSTPVILCHGLGANRYDLDFDEHYSLARFLARRGFETWVLELRGRGHAGPAKRFNFDDQAEHDVAAAIATVLEAGATRVAWVGHSKGGLVAYAHLARNPTAPISAIVTLGSPVALDAETGLKRFVMLTKPAHVLNLIPMQLLARASVVTGLPPEPIGSYLANVKNLEPRVVRQAIYNVSADVSGAVARQFARWMQTGAFDSDDGFDYFQGMRAIRVPVLLIAGTLDKMATPKAVLAAREVLAGEVETLVAEGFGHGDLAVGIRAPDEIFTRVLAFLERVTA
jgi:pimeloyl-ACP methyl ester carboxylesterase